MLLSFRVTNYRSIHEELELSFEATTLNEGTAVGVGLVPSGTINVLPVIGVYGQNASGKSNLLRALSELRNVVMGRERLGTDRRGLPWDPFALDPAAVVEPTRFKVDFVVDSVRYAYGLAYTGAVISDEWLHAYPHGRRQVWFERESGTPAQFRFPDNHLGSARALLAEMARPERPFLGLGMAVHHDQLSPLAEWIERMRFVGPSLRQIWRADSFVRLLDGPQAPSVVEMLRRADLGIDGVEIVETESPEGELRSDGRRVRREARLRHRGAGEARPLPMRAESDGTISWLQMLRPLLQILDSGGVLIVDELDASLHPELAAETIRMFYDRTLNPKGAQLLFSSHDVTMLSTSFGSPLLGRDQVWFTEKNDNGATELYALADFKPRKGENLERGYLAGRYGATPGLSPGELARALWDIHNPELST